MPFCPRCRLEYRPEFDSCADCGLPLVPSLPKKPVKEVQDYSFLTNAPDGMPALILQSKLESFGIESKRLYPGAAPYTRAIFGSSFEGVDLYVPTAQLEEALSLLEPQAFEEADLQEEDFEA